MYIHVQHFTVVFTVLKTDALRSASSRQHGGAPSDGEEMTCELRGIVDEFSEQAGAIACLCSTVSWTTTAVCSLYSTQVEEFRRSVSQMSVNPTEQQMVSQTFGLHCV